VPSLRSLRIKKLNDHSINQLIKCVSPVLFVDDGGGTWPSGQRGALASRRSQV
jgi:hypothetical protein